jgi:long-chain-fatty-acid--CoA ligase ACSBG
LIITAGGENIPPVLIEDTLKTLLPAVSNIVLIGDARKFLSMLITLKTEQNEDGTMSDKLTEEALISLAAAGSSATTVSEAAKDPQVNEYLEIGRKKYNDEALSKAQRVQKWVILPVDFSVPGGELTPTMKLKRSIVHKKYAAEIDSLYSA